ncbi:YkoF family thiamine/hydroxymethylpyrimidine-binding protein [Ornithinimicrobium cavernae]|uniref:YkoF family thiamine/hydroxymethylpyrimidine-binding protein n=1 Tax=Ornithinimicrobium cavernae TaxID=2666047 RepID=UPI000D699D6A|nr:YkoF family thiamine/hydroxymethylpyrimidine-binding protein [Ornithinimicrobium cavernae]
MSTTPHLDAALAATPDTAPDALGIGMRLSIHPHCDDFEAVILSALADVADDHLEGLEVVTDEVSTYVGARTGPAEERLASYAAALVTATSRRSRGGHVVAHVLLSRGCPGEVTCDLTVSGLPTAAPVRLAPTGLQAVAQWSLYPLLDGGSADGNHMAHIERAIAAARERGTVSAATHYATTLTGDVAEVLATAVDAWAQVGAVVPHVVTHLTVSVGSPTGSRA